MPPHADHVDPDDLALLALGEHVDGVDDAHLAQCPQCRAELEELTGLVTTARSVTPDDAPQAPRPRVWEAVTAELGLGPEVPESGTGAGGAGAAVRPLRAAPAARRTTMWLAAAAAVAGLAVGSVATALIVSSNDNGAGQVVASTTLAALPDHSGTGDAEVKGTGADRVLELDVSGLTRGNGYYEVWLLDANGKRLVSLGLLDGNTARFPLPPEVDVRDFPVVDVSLEPADGNPAHSGDSIVRGTLSG